MKAITLHKFSVIFWDGKDMIFGFFVGYTQMLGIIVIILALDCQTPCDQGGCPFETLLYAIKAAIHRTTVFCTVVHL